MSELPEWLEPMAATLTQERFQDDDWVFERKLDGIRLLAYKDGADVRLLSRNRLLQNAAYPTIARAIAELPHDSMILDGEALGVWGPRTEAIGYHVFDVLWLDGRELTELSLDERSALLDSVSFQPPVSRVERLTDERPWERAVRRGLGGRHRQAP